MIESTDPPAQATKKKKTLAFLRNTPKAAPTYVESGKDTQGQEDDEDGLDMFRRSKDFFPMVINKQESESRDGTPESKPEPRRHAADDSDEETVPSSSRSSKRRRILSPVDQAEHPWRVESYDELYGPATPPRRTSKSPTPTSHKSHRTQSTPTPAKKVKRAFSPVKMNKEKGKESVDLVQSDLLPTPMSRSNSHQPSTDGIALGSDEDDASAGLDSWKDRTPSPRKAKVTKKSSQEEKSPSNAIVIDDSDDDDDLFASASEPKVDEFAHFVAAARQRQEAAKAAAAALAPSDDSSDEGRSPVATNSARVGAKKSALFPVVKIFVRSRIAAYADYDLREFGCHRKINQDMAPVRNAFVQWLRNKEVPVSDEMSQAIFLTWKGRRIYNSVSGLSLGWQPQGNNKPHERESGFTRDGVLLEAWTEEDFERYTADVDRQRLINRGELVEEGDGVELNDDTEDQAEPEVAKVRLFLKEKDTEAVRLTTFLDTQVRILIGAYRKQKKVPTHKEIRLLYEGDWLDPEMTVEQADIDDMCTVEVYLK
ncbi:hypothetical protein N0V93_009966 [Gnomoniopsis smithogilvyi]|uniref:Ubiquitin-like domain-containing protein n=1 Tax=Gnomoniopsis smithogilvyi TaxID=1191159 RepID=A0A9W8YIY9_9PEZI|nr:hypothetical protein N0V93_009966 [Gnomoniopsis smithogilvyi]